MEIELVERLDAKKAIAEPLVIFVPTQNIQELVVYQNILAPVIKKLQERGMKVYWESNVPVREAHQKIVRVEILLNKVSSEMLSDNAADAKLVMKNLRTKINVADKELIYCNGITDLEYGKSLYYKRK